VRGSVGGEKGCGEKKTSDGGARRFLKRRGIMEQGGSGTGRAGARWRGRGRGPGRWQRSGAREKEEGAGM
jgi:hypothetical protein